MPSRLTLVPVPLREAVLTGAVIQLCLSKLDLTYFSQICCGFIRATFNIYCSSSIFQTFGRLTHGLQCICEGLHVFQFLESLSLTATFQDSGLGPLVAVCPRLLYISASG